MPVVEMPRNAVTVDEMSNRIGKPEGGRIVCSVAYFQLLVIIARSELSISRHLLNVISSAILAYF